MSKWILNALDTPTVNGIYEVRLGNKFSLIDPPIETLMEFRNGNWIMIDPVFINNYYVHSWRAK